MARFTVTSSPAAESRLADLIVNSPTALAQDITIASDRIDRDLEFADLLLLYRHMASPPQRRAHRVHPLIAIYEIDDVAREVVITDYQLVIQLFQP